MALKPPFWLLSLPLFVVLFRNTAVANNPEAEDNCNDDLDLEAKRILAGATGKDKRVNGNGKGIYAEEKKVTFPNKVFLTSFLFPA